MNAEYALKIVKARVDQDKYAAVELKIIKTDGVKILKDLYVERELQNGELFVVSDNVLVALHRALRNGEVSNLQLITNQGDVLISPEYSDIREVDHHLFIAVKAVSNMISVKNNQALKADALKVQEIAADSRNIKDQMINMMKSVNPTFNGELKFLYEDAYNEAVVYQIEKKDNRYQVRVVGAQASFVATDGVHVYSHSNIVTDLTKVERIGEEEKILVRDLGKQDVVPMVTTVSPTPSTNPVSSVPVNHQSVPSNFFPENEEKPLDQLSEVQVDPVVLPETSIPAIEEKKEEVVSTPSVQTERTIEESPKESQVFDQFFEDSHSSSDVATTPKIEDSYESTSVAGDQYEQLGEMISQLVSEQKASKGKVIEYEERVKELEARLEKAQGEIDSKTKKVNALINDNRQKIDENRMLKNRVSGLESKAERLEEENKKYLEENNQLKTEAQKGNAKLTNIISSVSELLDGYGDEEHGYTVKTKVA